MNIRKKFKFNLSVFIVLVVLLLESVIANIVNRTYAVSIPQKYDLRSEIPIVVKNQYQNNSCASMSRSTLLETHVKLGQKKENIVSLKKHQSFQS